MDLRVVPGEGFVGPTTGKRALIVCLGYKRVPTSPPPLLPPVVMRVTVAVCGQAVEQVLRLCQLLPE